VDAANSITAICTPNVRPVPVGIMSRTEKLSGFFFQPCGGKAKKMVKLTKPGNPSFRQDLQRAAHVMASTGLTYVKDKVDGEFVMDPPVDKLGKSNVFVRAFPFSRHIQILQDTLRTWRLPQSCTRKVEPSWLMRWL